MITDLLTDILFTNYTGKIDSLFADPEVFSFYTTDFTQSLYLLVRFRSMRAIQSRNLGPISGKYLVFSKPSIPVLRSTQRPFTLVVKRPRYEADYSHTMLNRRICGAMPPRPNTLSCIPKGNFIVEVNKSDT